MWRGKAVALGDGRAIAIDDSGAEFYDPKANLWTEIPGLSAALGSTVDVLPTGQVLVVGGSSGCIPAAPVSPHCGSFYGTIRKDVAVFDPATGTIRAGRPLQVARAGHAVAVLHDGTVLAIGGATTGGVATDSVERVSWEPIATALDPGFYVAASNVRGSDDGGVWAMEVNTGGESGGPLFLGGSLPAGGNGPGWAALYLASPQTVAGAVSFQQVGSGPFAVTLRLLDANKQPEAPPVTGGARIEFSRELPAGFHVLELKTGEGSQGAAYQFGLSIAATGIITGGVLDGTLRVPGYVGFSLPEHRDVWIRLANKNTYGSLWGAGEVTLTLYDSSGNVIARSGM